MYIYIQISSEHTYDIVPGGIVSWPCPSYRDNYIIALDNLKKNVVHS